MRCLTLSGWGQPANALAELAPEATLLDYARHTGVADALAEIAEAGRQHEVVVGWSLGGQLAVCAIAAGLLKPKKLVLIGVPFQFVATPALPLGMKRELYDKFYENYARNPARTLHKAWELIAKGDKAEDRVRARSRSQDAASMLEKDWLGWLGWLGNASCAGLNFSDFPPTLLLHGESDAVVGAAQARYFARVMPNAALTLWPGCGHAPHWHDADAARQRMEAFLHV